LFTDSSIIFISLEKQQSKNFDKFEKKILNFPEVVECWLMTGAKDYLIRIAVKDVEEFEDFLTKKLTVIDGVSSVETSIPLRRVKSEYSRVE
jgi:Lrp/AsnC family leucine-responsive transcriptional regulator